VEGSGCAGGSTGFILGALIVRFRSEGYPEWEG
jgi:hypothetical protein